MSKQELMSPSTGPAKEIQSCDRDFVIPMTLLLVCILSYLVIINTKMQALWKLHGVILIDSPEVAMVRPLTLAFADGSVEVVPISTQMDCEIKRKHLLYGIHIMFTHKTPIS